MFFTVIIYVFLFFFYTIGTFQFLYLIDYTRNIYCDYKDYYKTH